MPDSQADDWFVPNQTGAAPKAPGDDWIVPEEPKPSLRQRISDVLAPGHRIGQAGIDSAEQAFGGLSEGRFSPENEKWLQEQGLIRKPGENYSNPVQTFDELLLRTGAATVEDIGKGFSAAIAGPAGAAAQAVKEFGGTDAQAERARRDVGGMEEMALISHVPESDMLHGAQPKFSTPEEIKEFIAKAPEAPPAPVQPSATRAEIDEFLAQKAAREAQANQPQALPPPAAAEAAPAAEPVPPAAPGPAQSDAGMPAPDAGVVSAEYPSFEEPGRTAPAPAPVEEAPAAQSAPAPPPTTLKALHDDVRTADEIRQSGQLPQPEAPKPAAAPPPVDVPSLKDMLADGRSADQIRADIEAAKKWQPTNDWQVVPEALVGQVSDNSGLEIRSENGKTVARIPPRTGTVDNPIVLTGPVDVLHGAEHTGVPTPGQNEAENFQMRHADWHGVPISIKTEVGGQRIGTAPDGTQWSVTAQHPEGYIKRVKGADKENLDFVMGPHPASPHVYVVDQIDPQTGKFNEHKVFGGFGSAAEVRAAYEGRFSDGSGRSRLGDMQRLTVAQFKQWLKEGDLRKPLAYSDPVEAAKGIAKDLDLKPTPAAFEQAGQSQKVNNVDPTEAIATAVENDALAHTAKLMDDAREKGLGDAWTTAPATEGESGEGPHAPGEQAAGVEPAGSPTGEAPRLEPAEAERASGEAVEAAEAAAEPAEPELSDAAELTAVHLRKFAKKLPSLDSAAREPIRARVAEHMQRMEEDGRKIAEHCVETGGRFSLRG